LNIFLSFVVDTYKDGAREDIDDELEVLDGLDDEPIPFPTARRPYVILKGENLTMYPSVKGARSSSLALIIMHTRC
jgi:hypothetical protein